MPRDSREGGMEMAREMAQKKEKFVNGINVDQIFDTIDIIKENQEIARFNFRATNQWIAGTHNRATVEDFYGALKEDSSREPMPSGRRPSVRRHQASSSSGSGGCSPL